MDRDSHGDEDMITDVLDLVRSVVRDSPEQAAELTFSLEDVVLRLSFKIT